VRYSASLIGLLPLGMTRETPITHEIAGEAVVVAKLRPADGLRLASQSQLKPAGGSSAGVSTSRLSHRMINTERM
jgi:hypothetical protein